LRVTVRLTLRVGCAGLGGDHRFPWLRRCRRNGILTTAGWVMFRSGVPGATENLVAQNAMAPRHLRVPAGTTVTL